MKLTTHKSKLHENKNQTIHTSETFDVGKDTLSPVADAYFDRAPFAFEGNLKKLHFKNMED